MSEAAKIIWLANDPEPITWDEYCRRMQQERDAEKSFQEGAMEDCIVMRETLLYLHVCSRLTLEQAADWAHRHLCGTTNGWQISNKHPQDVQCESHPDRKHYMFMC